MNANRHTKCRIGSRLLSTRLLSQHVARCDQQVPYCLSANALIEGLNGLLKFSDAFLNLPDKMHYGRFAKWGAVLISCFGCTFDDADSVSGLAIE